MDSTTSAAPSSSSSANAAGAAALPGTADSANKLAPVGICLDLRDERLSINRETLLELPESILLLLFPNGVILNSQPVNEDGEPVDEEDVYFVDFDKACLEYILSFYDRARSEFYESADRPTQSSSFPPSSQQQPTIPPLLPSHSLLFYKQAVIVLREELEYFVIPPNSKSTNMNNNNGNTNKFPIQISEPNGQPTDKMFELKRICGEYLKKNNSIFAALQRNGNSDDNVAEQHLSDMLCMSGFDRMEKWGYREIEPARACIVSLALVLLRTGITHENPVKPTPTPMLSDTTQLIIEPIEQLVCPDDVSVHLGQLAIAQKLLLFWRKPARKCWWDLTEVDLIKEMKADLPEGCPPVKIWTRRVWTLELSLV